MKVIKDVSLLSRVPKDVAAMTEEEQMALALQMSLAGNMEEQEGTGGEGMDTTSNQPVCDNNNYVCVYVF